MYYVMTFLSLNLFLGKRTSPDCNTSPPTEAAFQLLICCFVAEKDFNAAIEIYRQALEYNQHLLLLDFFFHLNQPLLLNSRATPESAELRTNLGLVYLQVYFLQHLV